MKYWTEMSRLETQIIRFKELQSLFNVLVNGVEESDVEDIRSALWYIEGSMRDIQENMRSEFDDLWNIIREEDWESVEDKTEENYDWKNLDEVTRKWASSGVKSK